MEILVNHAVKLSNDRQVGHNRWHPSIPPVIRCKSGDTVVLETRDALDGQITKDTTSLDIAQLDKSRIHPLTGPVYIEEAEPNDILEVHVVNITTSSFGFTAQSPGFGFLRRQFPDHYIVRWTMDGKFARSEQLPGIRLPAAPFLRIMGVAPDHALLEKATRRETASVERGEYALPPIKAEGAVPSHIGAKGLRTIPPRENGGNIDIRHAGIGSSVYFRVFVKGALFSAGDCHFAQGDGEVCGQAIETCGRATLKFTVHKANSLNYNPPAFYLTHVSEAKARPYISTVGIPVDEDGVNFSENINLATHNAINEMINYLESRGYNRQQAYAICSTSVDLHLSQIVDLPNVIVTASLPLDIFE